GEPGVAALIHRVEQGEPLGRAVGGEHAAAPGDHPVDAEVGEFLLHLTRVPVGVAEDGDVARFGVAPGVRCRFVYLRRLGEQLRVIDRYIRGDRLPEFTDAGKFGAREGEVLDIHHSDPDASARIGGKFHLAPPLPGFDGADPDLLVAELRVTENTARRLDEWFVGAIVV